VLLLIDNYDSFTWNLVQALGQLDRTLSIEVIRNDELTLADAQSMSPRWLLISPGPCTPTETGVCPALIESFTGRIPILGVCLGHQAIAHGAGMEVIRHHSPMHGKTSLIHHDGRGLFLGLPNPFEATRYHSLIVDPESITADFERSAWTEEGEIMGLRRLGDGPGVDGVQFHPESFLTTQGPEILSNFLASG
jgi:anthranilate synthase/aminodeoxychorismate synthase-like glutamine amidotransferase